MKLVVMVVLLVALLSLPTLAEVVRPDSDGYIGVWSEISSVEIHWTGLLQNGYREWRQLRTGEVIRTSVWYAWGLGVRWDINQQDRPMGWWGSSEEHTITHGEVNILHGKNISS